MEREVSVKLVDPGWGRDIIINVKIKPNDNYIFYNMWSGGYLGYDLNKNKIKFSN